MSKKIVFYATAFIASLIFSIVSFNDANAAEVNFSSEPTMSAISAEPVVYSTNNFDYTDGYFDSNPNSYALYRQDTYGVTSTSDVAKIHDNNLKTYVKAGASSGGEDTFFEIKLTTALSINAFYVSSYYAKIGFYDQNGTLIYTYANSTQSSKTGRYISFSSKSKVKYIKFYNAVDKGYWSYIYEFELFEKVSIYTPISDINAEITETTAKLTWEIPVGIESDLDHISLNDKNIKKVTSYTLDNLTPDTDYVAKFDLVFSDGVIVTTEYNFKTKKPEIPQNVYDLTATATHKSVELTWKSKESNVQYAIYRSKKSTFSLFNSSGGDKIATTKNLTYIDDKVSADTNYSYTVTSVKPEYDLESDGTTVTIKTDDKPKTPELDVTAPQKDKNGDWLIEWTEPNSGKVKVLIDDVLYKTVDASDLKIVIPNNKMVLDFWGNPKVTLVHVTEDGTEQTPVNPKDTDNPFGGNTNLAEKGLSSDNLLKYGVGLFTLIAMFVLLSLAFKVAHKLIKMKRGSIGGGDKYVTKSFDRRS